MTDYRHGVSLQAGGVKIKHVHVLPIPDVQTQVAQMITGGLDMIHNVPKDQADNLAQDPRARHDGQQRDPVSAISLSTRSAGRGCEDLKDVAACASALIHAIDRDSIRRNIFAGGDAVRKMDSICKPIQIGCVFDRQAAGLRSGEGEEASGGNRQDWISSCRSRR